MDTFMGQALTRPRDRILPPKKRSSQKSEATIVGFRISTRISRKVLGTTSIVDNDTGSKEGEGTHNDQLAVKLEEEGGQDDIMIDLTTELEEVEPENLDSEKNWMRFEIPSSFLSSPKGPHFSHLSPPCPHFAQGSKDQEKRTREVRSIWNPNSSDFAALVIRLFLNKIRD